MRNILSHVGLAALDAAERSPTLVAFDFDGTLAPIVADRTIAAMQPTTWALLRLVSLLYPCAVVSGRSRADLLPRLHGIPLVAVVGNHGEEAGHGRVDRSQRAAVTRWRDTVRAAVGVIADVDLEDKGLSLAVHYRHALPRRAIEAALQGLSDARVVKRRFVFNVVRAEAPHKGDAVAELVERVGSRRAVYVGDDATERRRRPQRAGRHGRPDRSDGALGRGLLHS